ncbi:MAG: TetR/AcrR family transcriptional regulator [Polyangiaceae bacterium]
MGRPKKFSREDIVTAALDLASREGPTGVTIAALARAAGAPTGSIYHRFSSREQILGELWLDTVEAFQSEFVSRTEDAGSVTDLADVAAGVVTWAREHRKEAKLLAVHHRRDFVPGAWPEALVQRASALEPALASTLRSAQKRVLCRAAKDGLARLRFALITAPLAALSSFPDLPRGLEDVVRDAALGVLEPRRGVSGRTRA